MIWKNFCIYCHSSLCTNDERILALFLRLILFNILPRISFALLCFICVCLLLCACFCMCVCLCRKKSNDALVYICMTALWMSCHLMLFIDMNIIIYNIIFELHIFYLHGSFCFFFFLLWFRALKQVSHNINLPRGDFNSSCYLLIDISWGNILFSIFQCL